MKPNEIRSQLVLHKVSITSIAKELSISTAAIHNVINGIRPSKRIRDAISAAIGKPVEEVFPSGEKNRHAA